MTIARTSPVLELLAILLIILLPTVPLTVYLTRALGRGRRAELREVGTGTSAETPFVVISVVGAGIAVFACLAVGLTLLARALA